MINIQDISAQMLLRPVVRRRDFFRFEAPTLGCRLTQIPNIVSAKRPLDQLRVSRPTVLQTLRQSLQHKEKQSEKPRKTVFHVFSL